MLNTGLTTYPGVTTWPDGGPAVPLFDPTTPHLAGFHSHPALAVFASGPSFDQSAPPTAYPGCFPGLMTWPGAVGGWYGTGIYGAGVYGEGGTVMFTFGKLGSNPSLAVFDRPEPALT